MCMLVYRTGSKFRITPIYKFHLACIYHTKLMIMSDLWVYSCYFCLFCELLFYRTWESVYLIWKLNTNLNRMIIFTDPKGVWFREVECVCARACHSDPTYLIF